MSKHIGILTERRRAILKLLIQEYVRTAKPISSGALEANYGLGVSSATVRNELALLEEMGYLAQPHVSGGRVPTDLGYRYYVEDLMEEPAVSADERRMIAHQFHQVDLDLTEWLRLSAAVLAQGVRSASLVTAPSVVESHVENIGLVHIQDSVALLVVVLRGGLVQQQRLSLPATQSQEELTDAGVRLNRLLDGTTAWSAAPLVDALPEGVDREVGLAVVRLLTAHDQQTHLVVHYDGIANMLDQPEFADGQFHGRAQRREAGLDGSRHVRRLIELLQQGLLLRQLLPQVAQGGGVQIFIGGEGVYDDLRQYSVIVSRYGVGEGSGMLGVLGPTRMHYGRAVAIVRYMTELLTELSGELHG